MRLNYMSIIIFIAGAGFEAGTLDFCFLPYFVFVTAFSLSGCGSQNSFLHRKRYNTVLTTAPFLPPFIFRRKRSAKKQVIRPSSVSGNPKVVGSTPPKGKKINPNQKTWIIFIAGAGFEPTTFGL